MRDFELGIQEVDTVSKKTYKLVIKVDSFQENEPIKNVNVKVFRLETAPISLQQWAENLKNGTPFKRLMLSMNTDDNGGVVAELAEGSYEVMVEKYGLRKIFELTKDEITVFIAPKKRWWKST
jgi:hypothetical protein